MANYYETGSFDVCYNLAYEEYLLERGTPTRSCSGRTPRRWSSV